MLTVQSSEERQREPGKLLTERTICTLRLTGRDYGGVFCQMKDEAGTDVMTFSAVGGNQSVWGVEIYRGIKPE